MTVLSAERLSVRLAVDAGDLRRSVRSRAHSLGAAKYTPARALQRLCDAALTTPIQGRAAHGTRDAGSYTITIPIDALNVMSAPIQRHQSTVVGRERLRVTVCVTIRRATTRTHCDEHLTHHEARQPRLPNVSRPSLRRM